jgi:BASS family bile acid:Na+ symporter
MTTNGLIRITVTITLIEMMAAIGIRVKLEDLGHIARQPALLMRAAIANYVCVPILTVGLLLWFGPSATISAGFLIVAVCPGAAYGPPFTAMAKGNVAVAVGLMVILAGSSAVCSPLLLRFLLPLMAKGHTLRVDAFKLVVTLLVSQLLPLFAGLCLRKWRPAMADKLLHPADRMSAALNLCALALIVVAQFQTLAAIRARGFIGMLSLVATSMAAGWLLGETGSENRKAMGFSTSVRNVAVSLVVATSSFPDTSAVTAALVYGLLQTVALAVIAMAWGRLGESADPNASEVMMGTGQQQ